MTWALGAWDVRSSLDDFGRAFGSVFGVVGSFFGQKMTLSRVFLELFWLFWVQAFMKLRMRDPNGAWSYGTDKAVLEDYVPLVS